jgi:hypothetical protein
MAHTSQGEILAGEAIAMAKHEFEVVISDYPKDLAVLKAILRH